MKLSKLAEKAGIGSRDQSYFFGLMREYGLLEITQKLCQQAYETGVDDAYAEPNMPEWEE